jgi:hypothetical protein
MYDRGYKRCNSPRAPSPLVILVLILIALAVLAGPAVIEGLVR